MEICKAFKSRSKRLLEYLSLAYRSNDEGLRGLGSMKQMLHVGAIKKVSRPSEQASKTLKRCGSGQASKTGALPTFRSSSSRLNEKSARPPLAACACKPLDFFAALHKLHPLHECKRGTHLPSL